MTEAEITAAWAEVHVMRWLGSSLTEVRDQGTRGTCLAFATTAAHEQHRSDGRMLAPEHLFWAAKQRDGDPNDGTTFPCVRAALEEEGQPEESAWTYDASLVWPSAGYAPPDPGCTRYQAASEDRTPDLATIVQSIEEGKSVVLGVEVTESLIFALEGRVTPTVWPEPVLGHHAMTALGYGTTASANEPFLIVRNSWGSTWGWQGYALLSPRFVARHVPMAAALL